MGNLFKSAFQICLVLFLAQTIQAQKIITAVWVGNYGVTTNIDSARFLILIRYISDSSYQRVEYNMKGPMIKLISYKDPAMTIKQGPYYEYREDGWIRESGNYCNNLKDGNWIAYGDSANADMKNKFSNGELISSEPKTPRSPETPNQPVREEAVFPGGPSACKKFINNNFLIPKRAENINKDGTLWIYYVIDIDGSAKSSFLARSLELSLDDEAIRVINKMPRWKPGSQDGKNVKSYLIQPLTIYFQ